MIKVEVSNGKIDQTIVGSSLDIALDYLLAISSAYNRIKSKNPCAAAVFRGAITSAAGEDSPVWSDLHKPGAADIKFAPGAEDVIRRVIEGGRQHDGD